jgi:hypothetical protein
MVTFLILYFSDIVPSGENVTAIFKITWVKINSRSKASMLDEQSEPTEKEVLNVKKNTFTSDSKKFYK